MIKRTEENKKYPEVGTKCVLVNDKGDSAIAKYIGEGSFQFTGNYITGKTSWQIIKGLG